VIGRQWRVTQVLQIIQRSTKELTREAAKRDEGGVIKECSEGRSNEEEH
jgi:hypothetical protein